MPQHQPRVRRAASTETSFIPARPGPAPGLADNSPRALHSFGQIALTPPLVQRCACQEKQEQETPAQRAQFKLTVNTPGDSYEQEADATADQVLRMSAPTEGMQIQRCAACEEEARRKETSQDAGGEDLATADVSGVVSEGLASGGRPLDPATRAFMEPRFGHDFSQVRVHDNPQASSSAQSVAARAYTVGSNIAFRSGEFAPGSGEGRRLLAHELTHVVQQGAASPLAPSVQRDDDTPDGGAPPSTGPVGSQGDTDDPSEGGAPPPVPADPSGGTTVGVPQLSTPVNDALGVGLGYAGLVPGPIGTAATIAGGVQSATQGPTDPTDPQYNNDRLAQGASLGLGAASLLGVEAAGPLGLVASAGMAIGHGVQWLGEKMFEGGQQNNPGQFGPDPMDQLNEGQQGY